MSTEKTIPIVIGVTGHRMIREEDTVKLHDAVVREILRLRGICPNSQFVMLNSLCEGADLLCAEAAVELEIPLIAALPAEPEEYERDFLPVIDAFIDAIIDNIFNFVKKSWISLSNILI